MTPSTIQAARLVWLALVTFLLAACGGGGGANATDPAPTAIDSTIGTKLIQSAALNADGPATQLTVRAHGSLAGNVGPLMQVWVDGALIGTIEVRATEPTDYRFAVPPLRAGSKVDVVFTNDAAINGADRNLYVAYLIAGDTYVLPTSPAAVIDRGAGAAAFDGIDVLAGQGSVAWNAALRVTWPAPNMTDLLTVRASGSLAGTVGPVMALRVDGIVVGSTEVRSAEPADHTFAVPPLQVGSKIDVVYANAETVNGAQRKLDVAYLIAGNTVLLPTTAGVVIDLGTGAAAFDGANLLPGQRTLTSNGALRAKWPAPNMTDRVTVRASGSLAANVGPHMQVRVDGVALGTTEVRSTTPADFSFATLPLKEGSQIDIVYINQWDPLESTCRHASLSIL